MPLSTPTTKRSSAASAQLAWLTRMEGVDTTTSPPAATQARTSQRPPPVSATSVPATRLRELGILLGGSDGLPAVKRRMTARPGRAIRLWQPKRLWLDDERQAICYEPRHGRSTKLLGAIASPFALDVELRPTPCEQSQRHGRQYVGYGRRRERRDGRRCGGSRRGDAHRALQIRSAMATGACEIELYAGDRVYRFRLLRATPSVCTRLVTLLHPDDADEEVLPSPSFPPTPVGGSSLGTAEAQTRMATALAGQLTPTLLRSASKEEAEEAQAAVTAAVDAAQRAQQLGRRPRPR